MEKRKRNCNSRTSHTRDTSEKRASDTNCDANLQTEGPLGTKNIHDTYFKVLFSRIENVRSFMEAFYPELSACLELSGIEAQCLKCFWKRQ